MLQQQTMFPITHCSPTHGSVVYTSGVTLTASGFPFTVDMTNCLVSGIAVIDVNNKLKVYTNFKGCSITTSNDVITIDGAGTPFSATDVMYNVYIFALPVAQDPSNDAIKVYNLSQEIGLNLDPVLLLDVTNTAAATTYYPSTAGFPINYRHICVMGVTTGGVITTIEGTNDSSASPTWLDITKSAYDLVTNTNGNTSFIDTSFLLDFDTINVQYIRIKCITSDATNAVKYTIRQLY